LWISPKQISYLFFSQAAMKLYTIGFTQKHAKEFFEQLRLNGVRRLVDIRLNPKGQLAGFTKQEDLPYFLDRLVSGCQYIYMPVLAPTKEILEEYRRQKDWQRYEELFEKLLDERRIPETLNRIEFEELPSCLLCSEPTPERCHRRLVAERLSNYWGVVEIIHL
jgi:uncharacterized protein (DUF488 family)